MNPLPSIQTILAVVAHPDDESFGLGGVIGALASQGAHISLLCYTRGERSTLGAVRADMQSVRAAELRAAADVLGLTTVALLAYRDGGLGDIAVEDLARHVGDQSGDVDALLVFDEGGVTGHADHCCATQAALVAARPLKVPVLAWAIPDGIARQLNAEFGTAFVGRPAHELDIMIEVDRTRQLEAIRCHRSQSGENPVLWRRLDLLGTRDWLRYLRR
jgi:LmbE family N-acetylglucosaminyl deacetylase